MAVDNYDNIIAINYSPPANITTKLNISDEKSKNVCSTTTPIEGDKPNDEMDNCRRQLPMQNSETFPCDSSLMSCGNDKLDKGKNEEYDNNIGNIFASECASENVQHNTNESDGNCEEEQEQNVEETETNLLVEACGLSKLYLNDIEIDSKEEEQTVTELVNAAEKDKIIQTGQNKSMRVAFGVILRLIFPLANGVVQGIKGIRDVRFLKVIRSIASSRQALINLLAFAANTISMNLSSVQVSHRIEPILKLLKIRKSRDGVESLPDSPTSPNGSDAVMGSAFSPLLRESCKTIVMEECVTKKFCTLNILAEPPSGEPIRADIVFIHGLHGSLVNTWKQGLWENERRPVEFQRPPKPPVRPPKRPKHTRTSAVHPPHHKKRARFAHADVHSRNLYEKDSIDETDDENNYLFICGEPKDVQICDGIEYSFPTFRLRINDNGRLLQPEHDFKISSRDSNQTGNKESERCTHPADNKKPKRSKPSPNDPNYSKCWPGDWLPMDCPGVRVIALNYTTDQHLWRPLWKKKEPRTNLIQRAREMTELLIKHRVGYGHPIIWVGHSKGGLFIKQIIVDAWESGRPAAAPFWRSARGAFFYSVPHRGSHLASIKAPLLLRSVELIDIEKNNKYLLDLHRRFVSLYHLGHLKIEVFSFVETALTLMSVLYMRIVGVDSADPGIGDVCGIRLDHREICKPRSRDCILYKQLVNMINQVC